MSWPIFCHEMIVSTIWNNSNAFELDLDQIQMLIQKTFLQYFETCSAKKWLFEQYWSILTFTGKIWIVADPDWPRRVFFMFWPIFYHKMIVRSLGHVRLLDWRLDQTQGDQAGGSQVGSGQKGFRLGRVLGIPGYSILVWCSFQFVSTMKLGVLLWDKIY